MSATLQADKTFAARLMAERTRLVRYGCQLSHDAERAEDLASEAVARGWQHRHRFDPDTNLRAWLCTILRNHFLSEQRRKRWDGGSTDDIENFEIPTPASQEDVVHLHDVQRALALMPKDFSEALGAVALCGTYEEAAEHALMSVGTIKSRACRARSALKDLLA